MTPCGSGYLNDLIRAKANCSRMLDKAEIQLHYRAVSQTLQNLIVEIFFFFYSCNEIKSIF